LLAIGEPEQPWQAPQREFHLGFQAHNASEARALFKRMTSDRVPIAVPWLELAGGTVKFHCVDPGGYAVEVRWDAPR
jgi:hypothetical protein